ncbi:MAG TPA: transcription termination/antitermination NusG family protein [Aggregatilineaceae bacterium]|nr:transcription termination/antitermination NusG family protein [Aggregatilineaceae bacterium]
MGIPAWHVLHSKPHKENQLNAYLRAQGHEVFYPTLKVQPVNPRSSKIRPYFPGYMFIHVDIDEVGISALQWVPGANRLVAFDGYPATVPDHVIKELKSRVAQIEKAGGLILQGLERGDPVRITSGPFAGYEAIFDMRLSGNERVQILLDILGRQVKMKVQSGSIEKKLSK